MTNFSFESNKKQRMICKGKKIGQIKPTKTELILRIFQGFVTDEREPYKGPEYYRVMAWIDIEDEEYGTRAVKGSNGYSCFNSKFVIPLESSAYRYLYVEMVRGVSWKDPGTSNGTIVMGRAKIKLPPWTSSKEFKSRVELVGLSKDGCVAIRGYLDLSMELHRYLV